MALRSVTDEEPSLADVVRLATKTHELQQSLYRHVRKEPDHVLSPTFAEHVRDLGQVVEALVRCRRMHGVKREEVFAEARVRLSSKLGSVRDTILDHSPELVILVDPRSFGAASSLDRILSKASFSEVSSDQIEIVIDVVQAMEMIPRRAAQALADEELGPIEKSLDDTELWLAAHQVL